MSKLMRLADSFSCSCITEGLAAYWLLGEGRPGPSSPHSPLPGISLYRPFKAWLFVLQGQQESLSRASLLRLSCMM